MNVRKSKYICKFSKIFGRLNCVGVWFTDAKNSAFCGVPVLEMKRIMLMASGSG